MLGVDLEHFQPFITFEIRMTLEVVAKVYQPGLVNFVQRIFSVRNNNTVLIRCGAMGGGAWVGAWAGGGGGQSTCASQ